jgi:uncharacterized protein YegP (UPF0339 family)
VTRVVICRRRYINSAAGRAELVATKFVIQKGTGGKYLFKSKTGNGEISLSSETYESKQGAERGIESVKATHRP